MRISTANRAPTVARPSNGRNFTGLWNTMSSRNRATIAAWSPCSTAARSRATVRSAGVLAAEESAAWVSTAGLVDTVGLPERRR
ncbi:hypothetical protein GCM10018954_015550 [Kutzneria kofuensis]